MHAQRQVSMSPGTPTGQPEHPEQRLLPASTFRSRRSALSDGQRQTWERRWPQLGLSLGASPESSSDSEDGGSDQQLDPEAWFGRRAPLVLEIGCGSGTSTLAMAKQEPDVDVIAVEIYRRGLAQLLVGIDRDRVENIRLIRGNAVDVLQRLIAPASLTGVRVFFPDPWPKARHHKRRFLQPGTVGMIADRLLPGGVLHVATDHAGYAEHIGAVGDAELRLRRARPDDRLSISTVHPTTKYETKAHDAGSVVTEFIWLRD